MMMITLVPGCDCSDDGGEDEGSADDTTLLVTSAIIAIIIECAGRAYGALNYETLKP